MTPPAIEPISLPGAQAAVGEAQWIETPQKTEELADRLSQTHLLGFDTEFVRERTYYPKPGLVQISDGQRIWLIDVLTINDHSGLRTLIQRPTTQSVFHSVGEDLEVIAQLTGQLPANLFDTQIAAALLGFPAQMRYEHLVEAIFGVALPGGQARSNWCARPLSSSLLEYAAQDVIFLPTMASFLTEKLADCGRLAWLEEDCQRLINEKSTSTVDDGLARVKGVMRLPTQALAYADALVRWRDDQAKSRDLPKSFIVKDDLLVSLADRAAQGGPAASLQAHQSQLKKLASSCLDTLESVDPAGFEPPPTLRPLTPEEKKTLKHFQAVVSGIADKLNIDGSLLASKRHLTRILLGIPTPATTGWRGEILKDPLGL